MSETSQVVHMHTIDEMIHLVHTQFEHVVSTQRKFFSARIECGRLLNELRERVEAGEVGELATWWEWYDDHFTRSRSDAQRLMAIAAAEDPVAAYEAEKTRVQVATQLYRARAPGHSDRTNTQAVSTPNLTLVRQPEQAPPPEPRDDEGDRKIETIIALFRQLTRAERFKCVRRIRQVYRD
jgi:hypothetical protein